MSRKTRLYKKGFGGEKPNWLQRAIDPEGSRIQEAGYRDHLRNQDLAEQIREGGDESYDDSSYSSSSASEPVSLGGKIFALIVGSVWLLGVWTGSLGPEMAYELTIGNIIGAFGLFVVAGILSCPILLWWMLIFCSRKKT